MKPDAMEVVFMEFISPVDSMNKNSDTGSMHISSYIIGIILCYIPSITAYLIYSAAQPLSPVTSLLGTTHLNVYAIVPMGIDLSNIAKSIPPLRAMVHFFLLRCSSDEF